jgi:hypothetical protein
MPEPNIVGFSRNYWTRGGAPPPPQGGRPGPSTKQLLEQAIANLSQAPNNANKRARYIELRRKYNANTTGLARLMPVKGYNLFNVQGNPVVKKTTTANLAKQYAGRKLKSAAGAISEAFTSNSLELAKLESNLKRAQAAGVNTTNLERRILALKKKSTKASMTNVAAHYAAEKLKSLGGAIHSNRLELSKLEIERKRAQAAGMNTSALNSQISALKNSIAAKEANRKAQAEQNEAARKARAAQNEAARKAKAEEKEAIRDQQKALRNAVVEARMRLNTVTEPSANNRMAYARALQAYRNARLPETNVVALGINKYNRTGLARSKAKTTTTTSSSKTHYEFIRNMKEKIRKNPSQKSRLLDEALINLSRRLGTVSNNRRALDMIDNYRRLSSNATFSSNLNRRAGRYKKKNENKNKNKKGTGWSGGGQQIIFGGGAPGGGAGGAAPQFVNRGGGAAAPVFVPGPGAAAPVVLPGGGGAGTQSMTGPSITVAPTVKVNVPPAAAQAATQMLPPSERSALNNAGGYRRAASLVQNAGGPESVTRALNALKSSNGNVPKAMEKSGLPRNVFNNVNKLGGPVTARRTLTAVKKVSKKTTGRPATFNLGRPSTSLRPSSVRPATFNLGRPRKATKKKARKAKKYVSSACASCKPSQAKHIRLIVSQLRRINLERNYLKCLLP